MHSGPSPLPPLSQPMSVTTLAALPIHMRVLCLSAIEPSWITLALQLDAAGCLEPQFRWTSAAADVLSMLGQQSFDCILLFPSDAGSTQRDGVLKLMHAIRVSGCDDPLILVVPEPDDRDWEDLGELNCEILITRNGAESLALVPAIRRAIGFVDVFRENARLSAANQRRLIREREEAAHLLGQQRQMICELAIDRNRNDPTVPAESDCGTDRSLVAGNDWVPRPVCLPPEVSDYYQELLRTYVIMGSGSLGTEFAKLAELLVVVGLSTAETLELHLERVEQLVSGLGSRSTRHVMARADLMALELMVHLGQRYRLKSLHVQGSSTNGMLVAKPDLEAI
ncbi:MAG: hypothetical protein ABGZ17_27795 [Planctomycetaceae bacterium]